MATKRHKRKTNLGMATDSHLGAAQMWLKSSGHAFVAAKHAIVGGKCMAGLTLLTTASRRLGVAQGHLASIGDDDTPKAVSRKNALNRAFSGLKGNTIKLLDSYRSACATNPRGTTRIVCKNKLTDY
jgi:hypothetical protein